MAIHKLEVEQTIHANISECWKFFSSPKNLRLITPPSLDFTILSTLPEEVYEGLFIEYRVRPLFGVPVKWVTEITHVRAPNYFCDEQRVGPYRIWHHEHFFEALPDGTTKARDIVHYQLPQIPFADIAHPFLVAPKLKQIFAYRRKKLEEIFSLN